MPSEREPSLGEVAENLRDLRRSIEALTTMISSTYVRQDVYRAEQGLSMERITAINGRVEQVEERHTWISRTAIAALLLPIMVSIVVTLLLTLGGSS